MKICIGNDHGGLELKSAIVTHLESRGFQVQDVGCFTAESCDYPDYARKVADLVRSGAADRGILVCGTGIGMSIAANKVEGVRAAVVSEPFSARMAAEHNDARVLCLGQRTLGQGLALLCVDAWIEATFAAGRHSRRVDKISAIESSRG